MKRRKKIKLQYKKERVVFSDILPYELPIIFSNRYFYRFLVNNKIAPGTSGSFDIKVDATGSEVGINYNITFTEEENKPQNLKFEYNDIEYNSIKDLEDDLSGTINANDEDKTRTLNVKWKWDYETGSNPEEILSNDLVDTEDAKRIQNYTFDVVVTGTQVEPQA